MLICSQYYMFSTQSTFPREGSWYLVSLMTSTRANALKTISRNIQYGAQSEKSKHDLIHFTHATYTCHFSTNGGITCHRTICSEEMRICVILNPKAESLNYHTRYYNLNVGEFTARQIDSEHSKVKEPTCIKHRKHSQAVSQLCTYQL